MIAGIVIVGVFIILFFIKDQQNAGESINIAGKQRALVQRIALLSNNYFDNPHKKDIYEKIQLSVKELRNNHHYIQNIQSPTAEYILYDPVYQYDNLLSQYESNVLKFLNEPTEKLLKIINFTNESLLTTADTFATLLANDNDKKIKQVIWLIITLTLFLLVTMLILYNKVTLVAINQTEDSIKQLDEQKSFMTTVLQNSAHAIIATDLNGVITLFNKKAQEMLGYTPEEVLFKKTPALFHKESEVIERAKLLSEEFGIDIQPGFRVFVEKSNRNLLNADEWTYISKKGDEIFVKLSITALKDTYGKRTGYLGIAEDITKSKYNDAKLKTYVDLIDKNIITSSTDLKGIINYASEAFCRISGYKKDELIGKSHNIVRHSDMPKELYVDLWNHLKNDKEWSGEIKNLKKDGDFYWVLTKIYPNYDLYGKKIGYTAIRQDITDRKLVEQLSITDGLTNIYNRRHFNTIFPQMLKANKRNKKYINFLMMDVDHFKQYNDTYGHQMGDRVLSYIAKSLQESLRRKDDLCFRLGGEEFGAVFYTDDRNEAFLYAQDIKNNIENLKIEHSKNSASKFVSVSMGLMCLRDDENINADVIYREADELLYKAKEQGRNRIMMEDL